MNKKKNSSESRKGKLNPMYKKTKSIEFTNFMYKNKTGKNNPRAKPTKILNINTKIIYKFETFKDACIFLKGNKSSISKARDKNIIYKKE